MPELPEAERARQTLEQVLGRRIAGVDDRDTYVCRPHSPGEIADALVGHELVSAHRRGKFLWLETDDGPTLGLHLGMAGKIVLEDGADVPRWDRFAVAFEDGSRFALRDKRRLGRAVLNPDFSHVGPDAALVSREEFRRRIGTGRAPVKARLLDQKWISGVGNLLADETPLAGADLASPTGVVAHRRRSRPPAPGAARGHPLGDPPGRRPHGTIHSRPRAGRSMPPRRTRPASTRHDRRPDDLLVPGLPDLSGGSGPGTVRDVSDPGHSHSIHSLRSEHSPSSGTTPRRGHWRSSPAKSSNCRPPRPPAANWRPIDRRGSRCDGLRSGQSDHRPGVRAWRASRVMCWPWRSSSCGPRTWGWTAIIPGFGLLADEFSDPWLRISTVDVDRGAVRFAPDITLPFSPFPGTIGVAPAEPGRHSVLPPTRWGGNMDIKHLRAGTTLLLPGRRRAAHCSRSVIRTPRWGTPRCAARAVETGWTWWYGSAVRKDISLHYPQYRVPAGQLAASEPSSYHVCTGVASDLMEAAREATRAMIEHVVERYGRSREEAYAIASVAVDLRIHEVVDTPNWVVGAFLPEAIFTPA